MLYVVVRVPCDDVRLFSRIPFDVVTCLFTSHQYKCEISQSSKNANIFSQNKRIEVVFKRQI